VKQVNSPIEFYGDDFGADARLCHPSKEGKIMAHVHDAEIER